jgi:hypothetical protein
LEKKGIVTRCHLQSLPKALLAQLRVAKVPKRGNIDHTKILS